MSTVAELVRMNSDLDIHIGGSKKGQRANTKVIELAIAAGLMKVAWGVVSDVFGWGRIGRLAEVAGFRHGPG